MRNHLQEEKQNAPKVHVCDEAILKKDPFSTSATQLSNTLQFVYQIHHNSKRCPELWINESQMATDYK